MKGLRLFFLLAACGSAIALVAFPSTLPAANGKPTRVLITDEQQSFSVPAGQVCSFGLAAAPVANNETTTIYPADANGDVREIITGTLKLQLTNTNTGKSIVVNVSGPGTVVLHPDGSASEDLRGSGLVFFFPTANPAGPATYLFTGHTTLSFDPAGNLTLVSTTDKSPLDICGALS
jgi:hypothetical protein